MTKVNLIHYMGGKSHMLNEIIKNLDYSKKTFIDLFGGSGSVILNIPFYENMIYNDVNKDLVNLFMQIKNNKDEFLKEIDLPCSETIFKQFMLKKKNNDFKDDLERAACTFYLHNCGFSGKASTFGWMIEENNAVRYRNKMGKIEQIYDRISKIVILNKSYNDILDSIKKDKEKKVMLYVDPPYYSKEHYYNCEFTKEDHEKLAERLNKMNSSIMISYYYFDDIEKLYPKNKWLYKKFKKVKHSAGLTKHSINNTRPRSEELLLMNYSFEKKLF